jgi:hypothetical protein
VDEHDGFDYSVRGSNFESGGSGMSLVAFLGTRSTSTGYACRINS